jgi:hypothetical protein
MNLVLGLGRYVLDINSGLIADWYWYKAGTASRHTRLVLSLTSVLLAILYTQVAPLSTSITLVLTNVGRVIGLEG